MSQDTNVQSLIINKLTKQQFDNIQSPDPTQLYFITDDNGIASLDDISISNLSNGQILKYNSTSGKWENASLSAFTGADGTNAGAAGLVPAPAATDNTKYLKGDGTWETIKSAPDIDSLSITTNTSDELQSVGVIDQNDATVAVKTWNGTKQEFDAITTKDPNTLYNIIDDEAGAIILYNSLGDSTNGAMTQKATSDAINAARRNIGEVIASALPLTDAGLHLMDGTLLPGSGVYDDFVNYIAGIYTDGDYPDLFCSESDWQDSITSYGVCGKFVYDSIENTVRLPKITGILEGTTDLTALGDLIEAGLPNITGQIGHGVTDGYGNTDNGFITASLYSANNRAQGGAGFRVEDWSFDASRSSSIYGNSTTVQPQAIKVLYYIVVATSAKTEIEVDIDEITTDLNGKADTDLMNTTDTGKIAMSLMALPSTTYNTLTVGASGTTYTAPANGWVWFLGRNDVTDGQIYLSSNAYSVSVRSYGQYTNSLMIPVIKGATFVIAYDGNLISSNLRFIYAKGSESEAS